MKVKGKRIGYILTGSFCTFSKTIPVIKELVKNEAEVIPIMSYNSYNLDTKFGKAQDFIIGPKKITDIMVIAPCSGNTISKLAYDIIDTPATMATKSHLRNNKPLVIAVSTNNGLGANAESIGKLLYRRNYYFVPFKQDNPITKPRSIVADFNMIIKTIEFALEGEQISPII